MSRRHKFSSAQRTRLRDLGLLDEQTDELEGVLPLCKALLSKPATLTEVREKLSGIAKPLKKAMAAMDAIGKRSSPAKIEAYDRILLAQETAEPDNEVVAQQLTQIIAIAQRAIESLGSEQRRAHDANPLPIGFIEAALLRGFRRHYDPEIQGKGLPPYEMTAARKRGPFSEVAAICYETIGRHNEPNRAIRNYVASTKHRRRPKVRVDERDKKSGELVEASVGEPGRQLD
jgi:hypothetical protein